MVAGIAPEEHCVNVGDHWERKTLVQKKRFEHAQKFSVTPTFFNV